jgi:hypothetical protein
MKINSPLTFSFYISLENFSKFYFWGPLKSEKRGAAGALFAPPSCFLTNARLEGKIDMEIWMKSLLFFYVRGADDAGFFWRAADGKHTYWKLSGGLAAIC